MREYCVILVRPRDPNNIGACARAMGNFGLSDLRVVHPYAPVWQEAVSAVGVGDILKQAACFDTLQDALSDCHFSLAATALKNRVLSQEIVRLPQLVSRLQTAPLGRTALVFGNEKSGLCNDDIQLCNVLLHIPTAAKQPSINLAQAVILTCYELSRTQSPARVRALPAAPTHAQTELCLEVLDGLFTKAQFKTDFTAPQRKALLRQMLTQANLSKNQLFFLKTLAEKVGSKLP